jgi:hypothetical protein
MSEVTGDVNRKAGSRQLRRLVRCVAWQHGAPKYRMVKSDGHWLRRLRKYTTAKPRPKSTHKPPATYACKGAIEAVRYVPATMDAVREA